MKKASKDIEALIVMTTDNDGKLIPAENSVRFHYGISGPPYYEKNYSAIYIKNKVKLLYSRLCPNERIEIDSIKDGHIAEYKKGLCRYTIFGKNAGRSKTINQNDLILYNCTIQKGSFYEEKESGEVVMWSNLVMSDKYEFPKSLGSLKAGDKVWFSYYYLGSYRNGDFSRKDRCFKVLPQEFIIKNIPEKRIEKGSYSNYIKIELNGLDNSFFINDIYNGTYVYDSDMHSKFYVVSLTKQGVIDAFVKKFGERIKSQMEIIENYKYKSKK